VSPLRPSFTPQPSVFLQSFNSCSQSRSARAEILPTTHCSPSTFYRLSPLSTVFTPNRSLTPLSTAFAQTDGGVAYLWGSSAACRLFTSHEPAPFRTGSRITTHAFSITCRLLKSPAFLFLQLLSFVFNSLQPLFAKHPGWGIPAQIPSLKSASYGLFFPKLFAASYPLAQWAGFPTFRPSDVQTFRRFTSLRS
jgi:hypothetical protein